MSITYSAPARTGVKIKNKSRLGIAAVVLLAGLVVWAVSSFFEPLTDADRARMLIEETQDLPQNR